MNQIFKDFADGLKTGVIGLVVTAALVGAFVGLAALLPTWAFFTLLLIAAVAVPGVLNAVFEWAARDEQARLEAEDEHARG